MLPCRGVVYTLGGFVMADHLDRILDMKYGADFDVDAFITWFLTNGLDIG